VNLEKLHRATWQSWKDMKRRVRNVKHAKYERYGGRGIRICDRWQGTGAFARFLADMGERPHEMTLERRDNDGDYTPDNCRWDSPSEQARNRRSTRLNWDVVNEIRGRREHGEPRLSIIARMVIPRGTIDMVWYGITWKEQPCKIE